MSENTNTFITGEVYPYQITDRTLSFIPKLSPAADDHFKELVTGKIKISLYDFSNGKGDNGIYTYFKEIAFCCDCIALNILQRPTQGSIADCAVDNLNRRIQVAQLSNLPSPYNLSIFLHVLQLDGKAYLRVDCNNPIFQKAFRSLEDVSVSAVECQDPKNSKNILWQKLCKRYEEMLPLSKNLTTELYPDWEHITYPDVNSRCEDFARQNIANSYLTHLNAGQQMIPPHLLMPYVEESIDYLQSEYGKNEYREKVLFLKKVFIDLNADDSIVRNIQPQFKTEEEPVINENTETDLEK